jgi:hypothetical protein
VKYLKKQQEEIAAIIAEQNHRAHNNMQKFYDYDAGKYDGAVEALEGIKNQFIALFAIDDPTFRADKFVELCKRKPR